MRKTKEHRKTVGAFAPSVRPSAKARQNRGITLIALVITIIVMLILVAVTISMAINGGLFGYAGKAAGDTQNAIDAEQKLANIEANMTVDELIDQYTGGSEGEDIVGEDGEIFSALYTETKSYTDTNGEIAVIPKGFSVGKSDGINTVDKGLVIQDSKGNQFVWIPVEYTATGILDTNQLDSGFLATFKTNSTNENHTDICASGYSDGKSTEEKADYYDMMKSVQKNKGFYIGRYEAGTTEERKENFDNGTDTLVVKRDAMPYNYVAWGKDMSDYTTIVKYDSSTGKYSETGIDYGKGAVLLSKELYGKIEDAGKYGVVSNLCYGVQWDAMLKFMGKDTEEESTNWGNYYNNDVMITRTNAKYYHVNYSNHDNDQWTPIPASGIRCGRLLTTGADDSFAVKNIYDVAGNCREWTMESQGSYYRIYRGRFFIQQRHV